MASMGNFLSKFGGVQDEWSEAPPDTLLAGAPNALGTFLDKFTTLTESYWFYNNTVELRFNVQDHKYYLVDPELGNLTPKHGVTNTCHIIDRSPALVPWASKKCAEKILRTIPLAPDNPLMLAPISLADFTALVMEAKSAHKDILEEAGDIGHMAHRCLELSIQHAIDHTDGVVKELIELPNNEQACNAARAALSWMLQHNVRWIKTEQKIYSKEYEFAGTMDGLALTDSCQDPSCCAKSFKDHRSLIDWKSSNFLHIEYLFQTAAYVAAELEEYGMQIDDRWILRLGKNEEEAGKFEPWYLDAGTFAEDFAGFLACLNLTKLVEQVEDRISVQKKGVRAAKKLQREVQKALDKMAAKAQRAAEKAQLKLDRAAEKERIKNDAKRTREEAKIAKRNMGRPEPDNAIPGKAEDTTVVEALSLAPPVQELPVCESVRDVSEMGTANPSSPVVEVPRQVPDRNSMVEEAPVAPRLFVIPEER